ncbi:MAG TPA: acyltransferase [Alphaproteobacteria bacterium]|nr:acyltransferase [Alphaproteobacteria bacterium]
MRSTADTKILELEGLRGVCACLVVLDHFGIYLPYKAGWAFGAIKFFALPVGAPAVMVFFILSGYVIGHSTRGLPASGPFIADYLLKRFIRLYPIFLIALVIAFLVAREPIASAYFALHALFLQNSLSSVPVISTDGALWSLNFEVVYYILFIAIWLFPRAIHGLLAFSAAGLVFSIVAVSDSALPMEILSSAVVASYAFWLFGLMVERDHPLLSKLVVSSDETRLWLPLLFLAANMATAAPNAILHDLGLNGGLAAQNFVNAGPIADVFLCALGKKIVRSWAVPLYALSAATTLIGLGFATLAGKFAIMPTYDFALIYAVCATVAAFMRPKSPSARAWRALAPVGGISYAIYAIHMPIFQGATELYPGSLMAVLLAVPATVAVAIFLEEFLQPRLRRAFFALLGKLGVTRPIVPIAALAGAEKPEP